MLADVRLIDRPFDPADMLSGFITAQGDAGGIVSFLGQVRGGDGIEALELRHYAPLTLPAMQALARDAGDRWPLHGLLALHRVGEMRPGDAIVLVAAAARHRRDAFAGAEYVMDHLKSDSWFWKRERAGGVWRWIEPRAIDATDLARWAEPAGR